MKVRPCVTAPGSADPAEWDRARMARRFGPPRPDLTRGVEIETPANQGRRPVEAAAAHILRESRSPRPERTYAPPVPTARDHRDDVRAELAHGRIGASFLLSAAPPMRTSSWVLLMVVVAVICLLVSL